MSEPRSRRKRFDDASYKGLQEGESEGEGSEVGVGKSRGTRGGGGGNVGSAGGGGGGDGASGGAGGSAGADSAKSRSKKKRRRGVVADDDDYVNYTPDEFAFNKTDYFKVEKLLSTFGWGRWRIMKEHTEIALSENDIEHIAR